MSNIQEIDRIGLLVARRRDLWLQLAAARKRIATLDEEDAILAHHWRQKTPVQDRLFETRPTSMTEAVALQRFVMDVLEDEYDDQLADTQEELARIYHPIRHVRDFLGTLKEGDLR